MKQETKNELEKVFLSFVQSIREEPSYSIEMLERAYPFHTLMFPGESILAFKKQRSIVTKMGQKLIPQLTEIIAKDAHEDVYRNYKISGQLDTAKANGIDSIINELSAKLLIEKRIEMTINNFERRLKEIATNYIKLPAQLPTDLLVKSTLYSRANWKYSRSSCRKPKRKASIEEPWLAESKCESYVYSIHYDTPSIPISMWRL